MIMCVLLCYPVSIRIYYQQGVLFLVIFGCCPMVPWPNGLWIYINLWKITFSGALVLKFYNSMHLQFGSLVYESNFYPTALNSP